MVFPFTLIPSARRPKQKPREFPGQTWEAERWHLAWLIRWRWWALSAQALAGILAFRYVLLRTAFAWPYFGTILSLVFFNAFSHRLGKSSEKISSRHIFGQLATDTLSLTALFIFTGGIRNPFLPFILIQAFLGGMLLEKRLALLFFTLFGFCLSSLYFLRNLQVISGDIYLTELVPLFSTLFSALVIGGLAAWLSKTVLEFQNQLSLSRERQVRIDRLRTLGALTSELSHQFATPLNTLQMRLSRLRKKGDLSLQDDLNALTEASQQCEAVLRQMVAAPENTEPLNFQKVDILRLLKSISESTLR